MKNESKEPIAFRITMLIILIVLLLFSVAVWQLEAGERRLAWDDPNAPGVVQRFTVRWANQKGGPYPSTLDIIAPETRATVTGLAPGIYYFVVTASNAEGTSGFSNEVETTIAPDAQAPTNLRFEINATGTIIITPTTPGR